MLHLKTISSKRQEKYTRSQVTSQGSWLYTHFRRQYCLALDDVRFLTEITFLKTVPWRVLQLAHAGTRSQAAPCENTFSQCPNHAVCLLPVLKPVRCGTSLLFCQHNSECTGNQHLTANITILKLLSHLKPLQNTDGLIVRTLPVISSKLCPLSPLYAFVLLVYTNLDPT